MKFLFELSKQNLSLSQAEAEALVQKHGTLEQNMLLIDSTEQHIEAIKNRPAYTTDILQVLFESTKDSLLKDLETFDWNAHFTDSFSIRIKKDTLENREQWTEKQLAKPVWNALKDPAVKMRGAQLELFIAQHNKTLYCCKRIKKEKQPFEDRRSHLRPRPSPISLHPKLARAMVNLTGVPNGETVLDPFCGSGGSLIEAGLMNLSIKGSDLNQKMVWKSMVNLKEYGLDPKAVEKKDFFEIKTTYDYIVTDLPYGLNSNVNKNMRLTSKNKDHIKEKISDFYDKVADHLNKILNKRACIIFPDYVDYKSILEAHKLKITKEFEQYIHSKLTRKILAIEKK